MQNFRDGDSNAISEHKRLQDKSNTVTHNKNLDDSFNDDDAAHDIKVQVQVDKDFKYRQDLKEQCEDNYKRSQYHQEESRVEMLKQQDAENYMSEQCRRRGLMQNSQDGDSKAISERKRLHNKSNTVTHNKNLDDSFNDDDAAHDVKVQAQVDKDFKYRQDLKEQCDDNSMRSQYHHEESRVGRSNLQDAENYMYEQYRRERQHKHDESQKLNDERESFKKDCDDYRDLQKALIDLEDKIIARQSHEVSERTLAVEMERERQLQENDELNDRMCARMVADQMDRQDRENSMNAKHYDEDREKIRHEDMMAQEKKDENKREIRDGLLSQIEENKQAVRDEKKKELGYRDQLYAVMEMQDERKRGRARNKKEADDQYFADLRQQIADNAVRREKEKKENAL